MLRRPRELTIPPILTPREPPLVSPRLRASAKAYEHKGLAINAATRAATLGGEALQLTRTEFDLLHILLQRGSGVVTKAELVALLGLVKREASAGDGGASDGGTAGTRDPGRIVETHIGNLRRKLGDDARQPRWLRTVRGAGYTLA
jgi:DNA-binding response OmpR family regulator